MKKALATLLAFAMIVTGFLCLNPNASEVKAATTTSEHGTFKAVPKTEWKEDNDGVPELDGYLFAGYYKDEDCAKANRASKGNATHAKFVSDDMLDVKAQVTNGMVSVSDVEAYEGKYVIRFVSSVESLNYKNIGFELEYTNDEGEVVKLRNTTSKVFKRIESTTGAANGEIDEYSFSPKVVGEDSEYFMTAKLPVDVEDKAVTYKVRAFWTTFDGTEVMGKTRCVSVNDGNNDIVNMVAEANAQLKEGADYTATYGPNADGTGADAAKVEVLSSDANGHTNIRVTLASGTTATGLKSATKFIIKDAEGNQVATAVYRNYYTDKAGTADTSWWDVNPTATRFEIASVSDLYGLASIVNGKKDLFYQNEIHLVRSVEVNDGIAIPASETSDGVAKWQSDTTPVAWTPIGSGWNADFRGIFDGDNNTISGLYMSGGSSFVGLFGYAGINNGQNAEIANVRLTNSYFSTSYDNVGSIISYGYGVQRLENVYSDAILVASTATGNVGGLVGRLSIPDKTIKSGDDKAALDGPHMLYKNCWFDGEINSSSTGAVNIGGIMGALNNTYRLDMINCLYTGTINNASTSAYVGGLFSRNVNPMWMELTNCLSTGEFNVATNAKGGLFATAQHPTLGWLEMNNCYTSASKAWNVNGYTAYTAADCQKISAELAAADVDTLFSGHNGAWVNDVEDAQTPILSSFASWWNEKQYEAGLDTSWYDPDATEYVITTASQLRGLSELSQTNNFAGKTIKLGADIAMNKADSAIVKKWAKGTAIPENSWTPICRTNEFAGTFDGQGYAVSGLYYNGDAWNIGFIGSTAEGSVIKNIKVVDSYLKSSGGYVGGVVGLNKSTTLENLYSNAIVDCTYGQGGGIVGCQYGAKGGSTDDYFTNGTGTKWNIKNVWFDGEVVSYSGKNYYGGIVGCLPNQIILVVDNALFTGKITGTGANLVGGIIGGNNNASTVTLNNCLALGSIQDGAGSAAALYGKVNSRYTKLFVNHSYTTISNYNTIASPYGDGSLTTSEGLVMLQPRDALISANEDTLLPMLEGETENAWVSDNATGWNNTDRGTPILATFAEWWITNVEHDELTVDFSWYNDNDTEFTLYDAGDMYGFAYLVNNTTEQFAEKTVKLGADIELNKVDSAIFASWKFGTATANQWTPIGTSSKPFAGTFNGQEYEIRGLYYNGSASWVGLFGYTSVSSVLKNIRLVDSYIKTTNNLGGAIVGQGYSLLYENIYTNAYVNIQGGFGGGLFGRLAGVSGGSWTDYYSTGAGTKCQINNCWFDGEVVVTSGKSYYGGFIGQNFQPSVIVFNNCLNTGEITGTGASYVGGFFGLNGHYGYYTFNNCLMIGTIESGAASAGAFNGAIYNYTKMFINNSYTTVTNYDAVSMTSSGTSTQVTKSDNIVQTRAQLINTEATSLFPALEGEEESAWVNDIGWNDTDRGTPILASFAEWWLARQAETELNDRADTSWYNDNDTEFVLTTQGQLYGFAQLGQTKSFEGKTIKIGKDIALNRVDADILATWKNGTQPTRQWIPVGTSSVPFKGTFDGQGYTISGLYLNSTTVASGMFGTVAYDAEIKNFQLVDSYMKSTQKYLGLVGSGLFKTLENVYSNAYMETSAGYTGGFIGQNLGYGFADAGIQSTYTQYPMTISNCWFDGEIISASQANGGFIGERTGVSALLYLKDCLFTGTIKSTLNSSWVRTGAFVGWVSKYGQYNINNCLAVGTLDVLNTDSVGGVGHNNGAVGDWRGANAYVSGMKFYGTGVAATFTGTVLTRDALCDADVSTLFTSDAWVNDIGYNDTNRGTPMLKTFAEWWMKRNPASGLLTRPDISWYDADKTEFTLTTAEQLYGFAQLAKTTTFEGKTVKLGANITLNEVDETILAKWQSGSAVANKNWTPIGTSSTPFAGTFDGQGYEISGLYHESTMTTGAGLFGNVAYSAQIKNFKLVDTYISASGNVGMIGEGLISKVEKVYSNAIIESDNHYAGGMLGFYTGYYTGTTGKDDGNNAGWADGIMTFNNCWFDGEIHMKGSAQRAGGVIGGQSERSRVDITNCLYTGHISAESATSARLGGLFGWVNSTAQYNFTNCLSVGSFEAEADTGYVGGFVGNLGNNTLTLTNCYTTYAGGESVGIGVDASYAATYVNTSVMTRSDLYLADMATLFTDSTAWVQDTGYNDIDRGTPILATFAEWWIARQDEGALEVAPSVAWYTEPEVAGEYVIENKGDLLGFLSLSKQGETFDGATIKLGANITLNTPDVDNWKAGTKVPTYQWTPVDFKGNFDGDNHYIKGVYVKSSATYVGFFGQTTAGSTISNFRLLDSYIEQTAGKWSRFTGSIVGDGSGNIDNVYSNATVLSACNYVGGIVGHINPTNNASGEIKITNCWFAGIIQAADGIGNIGGIVGKQNKGKLFLENILYTGHIKAKPVDVKNPYIGGVLGMAEEGSTGTELNSVVSAGTFDIPGGTTSMIGAVVGYLYSGTDSNNTANYVLNNVFANREWGTATSWGGGNGTHTGQVIQTSHADRLIGFIPQTVRDITNKAYQTVDGKQTEVPILIENQKLDFTSAWTMRTNDVPVPTALKDVVDVRTIVTDATMATLTNELALGTIGGNLANAVAEGAGDYLVTVTGAKSNYDGYLSQLKTLGFTKYADNAGTTMESDGIYSATYTKSTTDNVGEWVVNVTFVTNDGKIYVSINSDVDSVAKTLLNDDTKNPIGVEDGTNAVSLSMVEDKEALSVTGNCFVFQLPNGHFIINDGNSDGGAGAILKAYLQSQVGEGKPIIIDAWTITHFHNDHAGALMDFVKDSSLRENVYLNAVYANEPSAYGATKYETRTIGDINGAIQGAKLLTKSPTDNSAPDFYEVHMGQRYYFNGITMDIVNTPEQLPVDNWQAEGTGHVPDPFNTSSVNFVFTIMNEVGKRVLIGGDSTKITMQYVMGAYGQNNNTLANINVFAAYHHGKNVMNSYDFSRKADGYVSAGTGTNEWADFLLKNSKNGSDYKFDVMLFPNKEVVDAVKVATFKDYIKVWLADDDSVVYPSNLSELNAYYHSNAKMYFTTGYEDMTSATEDDRHGTVKINFNEGGMITYEVFGSVHGQTEPYTFEKFVPVTGNGIILPEEDENL